MTKLVIRHEFSDANNRELYGSPAFDNPNAALDPRGVENAVKIGDTLLFQYDINTATEPVAVSSMLRTQETAIYAGFKNLVIYPELNEEKGGLSDEEISEALHARRSPEATIQAVRRIIETPPAERVIIMHAYLIATLGNELGLYSDVRFTPKFGEIREFPI
jgi:phosphohistidine phosphatase SixA